jgi:phosphoribosylamine--glycine ligase
VPDFHPWLRWADIIILEANGAYLTEAARWQAEGMLVIGGTPESAAWELDRTKGMQVFKKAGIPAPPFREFNDYTEAIKFVERRGEPFYSKPCSDTADKSLSAKTGVEEDPTFMLRKWKKKHGRPPCPFLLQEAIEGIEFAAGGWFGPAGFAEGFEENFEFKKLFAGDLGQNCGEAGTVMRYVRRSKLAEKVLVPCAEQLEALGYVGNVDVNCIIDDSGHPWPLEWTMRLGWPAFNIETDLFACDPIEFLHALASGEWTRAAHTMNEVAVGVVLAIPPYPHPPRDYEEIVGVPLWGETEGFHPCECQAGENSPLASAGGYVGIGVGTGATVRLAARSAYSTLRKISMPASPFYRNDIGKRLARQLPQLQAHGFAIGLDY